MGMAREGFIARHGLWSEAQAQGAAELRKRIAAGEFALVRLAWADPHGASRAKALAPAAFLDALADGHNVNVATSTLDAAGGRVFRSFTRGGGMGLDEMTGSPNLVAVPDPTTFRPLPWADGVGWVLCDEYFADGAPFHFSTRRLARRQLDRLAERGLALRIGLEVEFYLAHLVQERLTADNVGRPGLRARPVATAPVEPGYSYHSETNLDLMQPILSELARCLTALGLPLRTVENEWGPGQVECTFAAMEAGRAADDYVLFRTAVRQICRRHGHVASFMSRPGVAGHYSSGWHLHQSLADAATGDNLFAPEAEGAALSDMGLAFLAGLLAHAGPATVFAAPTVNGYRRFRPNSLAPDRAGWGRDHRGALLRVLGRAGDPATRIENRAGEPAANPYLFIASQIAAGLDGIERGLVPHPADDDAYDAPRPPLPKTLDAALEALAASSLYRRQFGDWFVDYYLAMKRAELDRFARYCEDEAIDDPGRDVTGWEQDEYYDAF